MVGKSTESVRKCIECGKKLTGRIDQKFCSEYCRSAYHYERSRQRKESFYEQVSRQLKKNRLILKRYNKAGKATVVKQKLLAEGFNPKYFTHYWKNKKNQVYLFCYEYGFLLLREHSKEKYVLVTWQPYMDG